MSTQNVTLKTSRRRNGRGGSRGDGFPKRSEMSEKFGYDNWTFDRRKPGHLRVTIRTEEQINLPAPLDQFPPLRGRSGP